MQGLVGCGLKTACGIAKYGLGDRLVWVGRNYDNASITEFLAEWRAELCRLLEFDPDGHIGRKCVALAKSVPDTFPKTKVLRYYANPLTSWSEKGHGGAAIPHIHFITADISGLALFCSCRFGWSPDRVHKKLKALLWSGYFLRYLCSVNILSLQHFEAR